MKAIKSIFQNIALTSRIKWLAIILVFAFISGCRDQDEEILCPASPAFCSYVNSGDYESVETVISDYVSTLSGRDSMAMAKVTDWLNCSECVIKTSFIYIDTNPLTAEVGITFLENGRVVVKALDIWMSSPMESRGFH